MSDAHIHQQIFTNMSTPSQVLAATTKPQTVLLIRKALQWGKRGTFPNFVISMLGQSCSPAPPARHWSCCIPWHQVGWWSSPMVGQFSSPVQVLTYQNQLTKGEERLSSSPLVSWTQDEPSPTFHNAVIRAGVENRVGDTTHSDTKLGITWNHILV